MQMLSWFKITDTSALGSLGGHSVVSASLSSSIWKHAMAKRYLDSACCAPSLIYENHGKEITDECSLQV